MSNVLVPLADGFEETEAVTVIDLLRRAGITVTVAALRGTRATGSHGIAVEADAGLDDALAQHFDMVVLPGGQPGADHLKADPRIGRLLAAMAGDGRYTAAICAAPAVLAAAGVLDGKRATSYPGALQADSAPGLDLRGEAVVVDGTVITSRGPGTAMDFALTLVETLAGRPARDKVEAGLQR